jgi:plastocyanin
MTPTAPAAPAAGTVTVNIVSSSGNTAFNPDPVQVMSGNMIVFKNNTGVAHHLAMDDGSVVFGDIAAGSSSAPMALSNSGGNYHCTIHPSMVGNINGAAAPQPPMGGGPGY